MTAIFAILDSLTGGEVLMILVFALVVLGPERLPGAARSLGQQAAKLRKLFGALQAEAREVMDDPSMQPIREFGEFVADPRKKITQLARDFDSEEPDEAPKEPVTEVEP